jgi:hypothetical protein
MSTKDGRRSRVAEQPDQDYAIGIFDTTQLGLKELVCVPAATWGTSCGSAIDGPVLPPLKMSLEGKFTGR